MATLALNVLYRSHNRFLLAIKEEEYLDNRNNASGKYLRRCVLIKKTTETFGANIPSWGFSEYPDVFNQILLIDVGQNHCA